MPAGVLLIPRAGAVNLVDDVIAQGARAHELGVKQVWLAQQQLNYDAIALAGLVGAAVPGLDVGTSVVPINPRHPLIVAQLAQTAQAATHGNFSLGLGLGAALVERPAFGSDWTNVITRLREHLTILRSAFDTGSVDFHGSEISASPTWPLRVAGGTGELADGTIPYLAGPKTIGDFIVPRITKAAADAGRPAPHVIAAVPVQLSADIENAREVAAQQLSFYESIPSYRKVIAREGVDSVLDLPAVGPEETVVRQLHSYLDAGATELTLSPLERTDSAEREALWSLAAGF
ncbi:TIGR03564 family F420-dependent LLM class oxidoreductase [Mycobacterium sp.]|uniref:TIGR03564 family F420-dependent LLM class oxidoreductase n=1 Tax=Mycobacterium sp. TaxID=1785 RepID=UPI003D15234B